MSALSNAGLHRTGAAIPADGVGIYSISEQDEAPPIGLAQLGPAEARISMPAGETDDSANPINVLTRFIGPALTVNSPAWSGDPVHAMRALQKKLVECSLARDEADRAPCLAAISVVEDAVQWRLRLQQMRMNEVERDMEDQARKVKAA